MDIEAGVLQGNAVVMAEARLGEKKLLRLGGKVVASWRELGPPDIWERGQIQDNLTGQRENHRNLQLLCVGLAHVSEIEKGPILRVAKIADMIPFMATNTLDQVVTSHTRKVATSARRKTPAFTNLEKASLARNNIQVDDAPVELDELFPRFDPAAMTTAYQDEKLGFTLPALFAFDLQGESAERMVSLQDKVRFSGHNKNSREVTLNQHALPLWKAINEAEIEHARQRGAWSQLAILSFYLLLGCSAMLFLAWQSNDEHVSPFGALPTSMLIGLAAGAILGVMGLFFFLRKQSQITPGRDLAFRVAFEGLIPDKVRRNIELHREKFDAMYLVCDVANSWAVDASPRPLNRDPLVVGEVSEGLKKPVYYLVDQFDLTPIEDHTVAEWTAKS